MSKEDKLSNSKKSKKHFKCKASVLEAQDLKTNRFTKYAEVTYSGDDSGWYSEATMKYDQTDKTYSIKSYDGLYVLKINNRDGSEKEVEFQLYELADLIRLFQITEKFRTKMGKNIACCRTRISNIKAKKIEVL